MEGNLADLLVYENRQVVVNEYRQDEFLGKDGFAFESIAVSPGRLEFTRKGAAVLALDIPETARFARLGIFPRYYSLEWDDRRIELYFP